MARPKDIFPRNKNGRLYSWYTLVGDRRVNLKTKDVPEARRRRKLALEGRWPPPEEAAADATRDAFSVGAQAQRESFVSGDGGPGAVGPAPASPGVAEPETSAPSPAQSPPSDWTQAAQAAAAEAAPPPITPEVVNPAAEQAAREAENLQLATLLTTVQFWVCGVYAAAKAKHPEFVPPEVPAPVRAIVTGSYKQMLDYGGAAIALPPWVMGVVMPAATVIATGVGCARAWADLAKEQKAQAPAKAAA